MGASTVKWRCFDPCTCLSESVSKQDTNFEFWEKRNIINIKKNIMIYKAKRFILTKKKVYILEINASGYASGDIEQVIIKILF
jgi:hypothetical protein